MVNTPLLINGIALGKSSVLRGLHYQYKQAPRQARVRVRGILMWL
jgi:dTDP-4-dehydrorhamnose 3,5-epimerase-like enzyme